MSRLSNENIIGMANLWSELTGFSPDEAIRRMHVESTFDPFAVGPGKEIGLMQIHPSNFKRYGVTADQLRDPETNIRVAAQLDNDNVGSGLITSMDDLHRSFNGGTKVVAKPNTRVAKRTFNYLRKIRAADISNITGQPSPTGQVSNNGRQIFDNGDGTTFSEKTITFQTDDKRWITIPSVGADGKQMSQRALEDFVRRNGAIDPVTRAPLPTFGNVQAAESFAQERSNNIQPAGLPELGESEFAKTRQRRHKAFARTGGSRKRNDFSKAMSALEDAHNYANEAIGMAVDQSGDGEADPEIKQIYQENLRGTVALDAFMRQVDLKGFLRSLWDETIIEDND